ncbi:MAG TPA: SIS domain-containing protein [Vicinamibacterales bacterium]|nr:SIS domain-containing protein [Vicinamibacterales bacterium]
MGGIDPGSAARRVESTLEAAIDLHRRVRGGDLEPTVRAAGAIAEALAAGGKVLVFGNGGSAADAQHLAAELVGRVTRERPRLAAVALAADQCVVTSVANDYGFDQIFARQIEALGRPGDIALAISTSGRSPNVLEGMRAAAARNMRTVALTGRDGGPVGAAAEIHVNVPADSAARVQEVHRTLLHAICDIVENE